MLLGDCQNYGPCLGPYYNRGPNTGLNLGDPKGTIILTIPLLSPAEIYPDTRHIAEPSVAASVFWGPTADMGLVSMRIRRTFVLQKDTCSNPYFEKMSKDDSFGTGYPKRQGLSGFQYPIIPV